MPTSASEDLDSGGGSNNNAKLIGGLVGSIGGTILIGSLVLLFLFLKKRKRNSLKNQNPDFNDSSESNDDALNRKYGFMKLFGSKGAASEADLKGFEHIPAIDKENDDFEYRGVTNNNLDLLFKSSASNSGNNTATYGNTAPGTGPGSGQGSGPGSAHHSRFNLVGYPAYDLTEEDEQFDFEHEGQHARHSSDDINPLVYELDPDEENLLVNNPMYGEGNVSNNSRSRFTEEII